MKLGITWNNYEELFKLYTSMPVLFRISIPVGYKYGGIQVQLCNDIKTANIAAAHPEILLAH